jgi:hypothetical protein
MSAAIVQHGYGLRWSLWLCGLSALAWCSPASVHARAHFLAHTYGPGFTDSTPAAPVGGNPGKTLGEQRKFIVQYALDLWGAQLDSDVPIEVEVTFQDLGCEDFGVAAQARPFSWYSALPPELADPSLLYVKIGRAHV